MKINELSTPCFLVDLDKLEENIKKMAEMCKEKGHKLCPMLKTHKSIEIATLQEKYGVDGFLLGTIDEAELFIENGFKKLVFPYPVAGKENIERIVSLAKKADITLSFDGYEAARQVNVALEKEKLVVNYLIIIDSGLHRFGILPDEAVALAKELSNLKYLMFKGISTHPGHVYGVNSSLEVEKVAKEEYAEMEKARQLLMKEGFVPEFIATGSTPTAPFIAQKANGYVLRPGNYVFNDAIQVSLGAAKIEECAFSVEATITANPKKDIFLIDAGSKCLGLDKGAHGAALLTGYGIVKKHPEFIIEGLSEEVGKMRLIGKTELKVGDKIEIIPNHACAAANMTSFLVCHKNGCVEKIIKIDARSNSKLKMPFV